MENEQKETVEEVAEDKVSADIKAAQKRVDDANKRLELQKIQEEEKRITKMLAGKSEAGVSAKKEETPKEYAARVMRGELD